ncbi:unnamed protein product [Ceratitis capitata]|uniref:(Mediterranean fruit fly) hypothetical protein n=1 Tax=Ceratitis capitata TaxID=7213 RepID=A0A811UP08_CERCA|nr:unnamed protein product [Ceratitis capitata]
MLHIFIVDLYLLCTNSTVLTLTIKLQEQFPKVKRCTYTNRRWIRGIRCERTDRRTNGRTVGTDKLPTLNGPLFFGNTCFLPQILHSSSGSTIVRLTGPERDWLYFICMISGKGGRVKRACLYVTNLFRLNNVENEY